MPRTYGTTAQRGYGAEHQRLRRKWKPIVEAGEATCCLCGNPIAPRAAWHLDHTPDRRGYRGVAHAACNIAEGQTRNPRAGAFVAHPMRGRRRAWLPPGFD